MIELLIKIATTVATIGGISAYLDAALSQDDQKRIATYLRPNSTERKEDTVKYSDALKTILSIFVSGPENEFDVFRSFVLLLLIFAGTSFFSAYIVIERTGEAGFLVPSPYTLRNLTLPYTLVFAISFSIGLLSIYQTTIFFRLFANSSSITERGLLVYSDLVLSLSASFLIAYVSILASAVAANRTVEVEVILHLSEEANQSGTVSIAQSVVGQDPASLSTTRLSTNEGDMHIDAYLSYLERVIPHSNFDDIDCTNSGLDLSAAPPFPSAPTEILHQQCFTATIRRPLDAAETSDMLIQSIVPAGTVTASSTLVGVFDVIYFTPTAVAAFAPPPPLASEAPRSDDLFATLIQEFALADNSRLQASVVISPFVMSSVYFTLMIYTLAALLYMARLVPILSRNRLSVPLLNADRPIVSVSLYLTALAVVGVVAVHLSA